MLSQCKRLVWINNNLRKRTNAIRCVNIKVTVLAQYFFLAKHPSRFRKLLLTPISLKLIRSFKGDSSSYSTPSVSALSVSLRGWGKKSWESEVKGEKGAKGKKESCPFLSLSLPMLTPFTSFPKAEMLWTVYPYTEPPLLSTPVMQVIQLWGEKALRTQGLELGTPA